MRQSCEMPRRLLYYVRRPDMPPGRYRDFSRIKLERQISVLASCMRGSHLLSGILAEPLNPCERHQACTAAHRFPSSPSRILCRRLSDCLNQQHHRDSLKIRSNIVRKCR